MEGREKTEGAAKMMTTPTVCQRKPVQLNYFQGELRIANEMRVSPWRGWRNVCRRVTLVLRDRQGHVAAAALHREGCGHGL